MDVVIKRTHLFTATGVGNVIFANMEVRAVNLLTLLFTGVV